MSCLPELRTSLVRAAERRIAAPARLPVKRRRLQPRRLTLALPTVMAIVVALGVAGIALVLAHGRAPTNPAAGPKPSIANPGPASSLPFIPARDQKLIDLAQRKTAARDHACSASVRGRPVISQGSPSQEMLSLLGVLRHRPSAADAQARAVFTPSPSGIRDIYVR